MISILNIRKSKWFKATCLMVAFLFLEPFFNSPLLALSGGPTSPEFAQFSGVGNGDFVDPFTGDVKYSVPLFDVGGYPVTLSYTGNLSTEQDAGWVGLGWNLNVGAITRGLRGVPDDFNGEEVKITRYEKPHKHFEFQFQYHKSDSIKPKSNNESDEFSMIRVSKKKNKFTMDYPTIVYDNYRGLGMKNNIEFSRSKATPGATSKLDFKLSNSSMDGVNIKPDFQKNKLTGDKGVFQKIMSFSPSIAMNSRTGLSGLGLSKGVAVTKLVSAGMGYTIPFFAQSSFPEGNYDRVERSQHYLFQLTKPKEVVLDTKKISVSATIETSSIRNNGEEQSHPAYGYFYMDPVISETKGKEKDGNYIVDVNVENKGWDKYTRELPKASKEYDVFTIAGSGVGGSVRAFDINPSVCGPTPYRTISVNGFDAKLEVGSSGTATKLGIDLGAEFEKEKYGMWNKGNMGQHNKLLENFNEQSNFELRNDFEFTQSDPAYMQLIVAGNPVRADMKGNTKFRIPKTSNGFIYKQTKGNGNILVKPLTDADGEALRIQKSKKETRQQVVTYNLVSQAQLYGMYKDINYSLWDAGVPVINNGGQKYEIVQLTKSRTANNVVKAGHIADFTVLQPDGSRYYYGFPLYNFSETNVSFSINPDNSTAYKDQGLTEYTPGTDNKVKNNNGIDHFYEKKVIPGYAHAFLLSTVLSPDYSDVDNNGPSVNDLGNYVKFNYGNPYQTSALSGENNIFRWRTPAMYGIANYNKGFISDKTDDKAFYSYGEKEMYYLHSIESKDRIAFFFLGDRRDGFEAAGENGGTGTTKTGKYLKQIKIYSRAEFEKSGFNAVPLQTVNLEYSYDLCGNVPNFIASPSTPGPAPHPLYKPGNGYPASSENKHGKLTLHKVWFTFGKNPYPATSPYIFEYKGINPDYGIRSVDRWGAFNNLLNPELPYSDQSVPRNVLDQNASAWMLTDISLPSGGTVHFDYEADDYGYVQDKKAMQMIKIISFEKDPSYSGIPSNNIEDKNKPKEFIIFHKNKGGNATDYVSVDMLTYFTFRMNVSKPGNPQYEQVSGFFPIAQVGDISSQYGYIRVEPFEIGRTVNLKVHPATKFAWQYLLANTPQHVYPSSNMKKVEDQDWKKAAKMVLSIFPEMWKMLVGADRYLKERNYGVSADLNKSLIRTYIPGNQKIGGGHRVKKVVLNDQWNVMTNNLTNPEDAKNYTLVYKYQNEDGSTSGVASYEPAAGGDENPFKMPAGWNGKDHLFKNIRNRQSLTGPVTVSYDLDPVGEEYYPSPSVGYGRVTIETEKPSNDIKRHATGYKVLEFYTAKDFPTIAEYTDIEFRNFETFKLAANKKAKESSKFKVILPVSYSKKYSGASQGFFIEQNDMHGKPKATYDIPSQGSDYVSGTRYYYKHDGNKRLVNDITLLKPDNTIETGTCGYNEDPTFYASRLNTLDIKFDVHLDVNISKAPLVIAVPLLSTGLHAEAKDTRLFVITKIGYRQGILDKVEVIDKGSSTFTQNLAWDALTGQVLLSKVANEHRDDVYSFTKPAHWMYKGMQGAYQNIDEYFLDLNTTNLIGSVSYPDNNVMQDTRGILFPGDELVSESTGVRYWVLDRNETNNVVSFIDEYGAPAVISSSLLTGEVFRIIRSGHRNILSGAAESISMQGNPIQSGTFLNYDKVINAGGITYSDFRQLYYGDRYCVGMDCDENPYNPVGESPLLTASGNNWDINYGEVLPGGSGIETSPLNFDFPELLPGKSRVKVNFGNCCNLNDSATGDTGEGGGLPLPPPGCPNCLIMEHAGFNVGQQINPFVWGIRGIWRPFSQYVYNDRQNTTVMRETAQADANNANTTQMRNAGFIKTYHPFWSLVAGNWEPAISQELTNPWVYKDNIIHTDIFGNDRQDINALNISSAVLYGYKMKLPIASAPNATVNDLMYEGFEEYGTDEYLMATCQEGCATLADNWLFSDRFKTVNNHQHWPVYKALMGGLNFISNNMAHTGYHSLKLAPGNTEIPISPKPTPGDYTSAGSPKQKYKVRPEDMIDRFRPVQNKEYLISMWVMEGQVNQFDFDLLAGTTVLTKTKEQSGNDIVIDGWRRLSYKFTMGNGELTIRLKNNSQGDGNSAFCFVDDMRVLPWQSNMTSYVYDRENYRLMAVLDANNMAVFYEYDAEGNLVRKKAETEKGIVTTQEQRTSTIKK